MLGSFLWKVVTCYHDNVNNIIPALIENSQFQFLWMAVLHCSVFQVGQPRLAMSPQSYTRKHFPQVRRATQFVAEFAMPGHALSISSCFFFFFFFFFLLKQCRLLLSFYNYLKKNCKKGSTLPATQINRKSIKSTSVTRKKTDTTKSQYISRWI